MELKYYGKPWLQAFKGVFFVILGVLAMMQIPGSNKSVAMFFSFFIGLTGFVQVVAPLVLKIKENRGWNIFNGIIHLLFALSIIFIVGLTEIRMIWILIFWVIFNVLTEITEAIILFIQKNAFSALFIIDALLSALLGYGIFRLTIDFNDEKIVNMGLVALVFGLVNLLSAYLLKSIKKPE
jgi:uncharacterized membrane protein HdeD (DUF308 family)